MSKHGKIENPKQLNLKDGETYELAAELATLHSETLTAVVKIALREKLERDQRGSTAQERYKRLTELSRRSAAIIGPRTMSDEEAIGYDEFGLPN